MKAAIVHGANDIRLEEVPQPVPEPGDIVVRVRASGICATDVKTLLVHSLYVLLNKLLVIMSYFAHNC
jgi:L-iditol 2-dehydrogenase